jgi:uncharacterized protein YndB with AHSA1/START domain
MESETLLTAEVLVNASLEKTWECWINPRRIIKWNVTGDDWVTTSAENDLRIGGKLFLRMQTKDGSEGFDYECFYDEIVIHEKIAHTNMDNRKTFVLFTPVGNAVRLTETFEPEKKTRIDVQKGFCQSVLDNFKNYVESLPG